MKKFVLVAVLFAASLATIGCGSSTTSSGKPAAAATSDATKSTKQ